MPISFIKVGRLPDHLLLTSTNDEDPSLPSLKLQCQPFINELNSRSHARATHVLQQSHLHICVSDSIFAFCVADKQLEPVHAYAMLERVLASFKNEYGEGVQAVEHEYACLEFHTTLEAIRSEYHKKLADSTIGKVELELNGVKSEMADNIKTALIRREKLNQVEGLSESLGQNAGIFAKQANDLNRLYYWRTYGRPAVVVGIVSLVYFLVGLLIV
jgi:hypothetical protein